MYMVFHPTYSYKVGFILFHNIPYEPIQRLFIFTLDASVPLCGTDYDMIYGSYLAHLSCALGAVVEDDARTGDEVGGYAGYVAGGD